MSGRFIRSIQAAALVTLVGIGATAAQEKPPIKIGEINGYSGALAAFTEGYRKGLDLAIEQANANGGVLGRKIEMIYRDDNFSPADSVRMANELVFNQGVDLLAGTYLSGNGLAVASFAEQNKVLFVATEPLTNQITWEKGSRYVFRVANPISMTAAALVEKAATLGCTKWAGTGQVSEAITDLINDFQAGIKKKNPDAQWMGNLLVPIGKFNPGPAIDQFQRWGIDCLLNSQAGPDLVAMMREAKARGFFDKVKVVSLQTGIPEWLNSLGAEAPVGWIVSGYPWQTIPWPAHRKFVADYQAKYNTDPKFGSFIGFLAGEAIVAGIAHSKSTNVEDLIKGFTGAEFECVAEKCRWRKDHQLDVGGWVGEIKMENGKPIMGDWQYISGQQGMPSEEAGLARRPPGAND